MTAFPIVFMFSGQGSQYYQMGKELFLHNATFKDSMLNMDQQFQSLCHLSVVDHLYDDKHKASDVFKRTLLSSAAIFMVENALLQVLQNDQIKADYVLGSSIGEFAGAVAAGSLTAESALQTLTAQSTILERYCQEGSMLAILHDTDLYHSEAFLNQYSELAAINFPSHFIVAGTIENLQMITKRLNENSITCQMLPVSYAFHSSYMDSIKPYILHNLSGLEILRQELS